MQASAFHPTPHFPPLGFPSAANHPATSCALCPRRPSVYCPADAAALCLVCDAAAHGANATLARHRRHPLCDMCGQIASFGGDYTATMASAAATVVSSLAAKNAFFYRDTIAVLTDIAHGPSHGVRPGGALSPLAPRPLCSLCAYLLTCAAARQYPTARFAPQQPFDSAPAPARLGVPARIAGGEFLGRCPSVSRGGLCCSNPGRAMPAPWGLNTMAGNATAPRLSAGAVTGFLHGVPPPPLLPPLADNQPGIRCASPAAAHITVFARKRRQEAEELQDGGCHGGESKRWRKEGNAASDDSPGDGWSCNFDDSVGYCSSLHTSRDAGTRSIESNACTTSTSRDDGASTTNLNSSSSWFGGETFQSVASPRHSRLPLQTPDTPRLEGPSKRGNGGGAGILHPPTTALSSPSRISPGGPSRHARSCGCGPLGRPWHNHGRKAICSCAAEVPSAPHPPAAAPDACPPLAATPSLHPAPSYRLETNAASQDAADMAPHAIASAFAGAGASIAPAVADPISGRPQDAPTVPVLVHPLARARLRRVLWRWIQLLLAGRGSRAREGNCGEGNAPPANDADTRQTITGEAVGQTTDAADAAIGPSKLKASADEAPSLALQAEVLSLALHLFLRLIAQQASGSPSQVGPRGIAALTSVRVLLAVCLWTACKLVLGRRLVPSGARMAAATGVPVRQLGRAEVELMCALEWSPLKGWMGAATVVPAAPAVVSVAVGAAGAVTGGCGIGAVGARLERAGL